MFESLEHQIATNSELGQAYFYWESNNGRLFLASQVTKVLGYNRTASKLLSYHNLLKDTDYVKFSKKDNKELFIQLEDIMVIRSRASEIIMLTESGFWKLVMQSQKSVGIKTRTWLAGEVLPSIRKTGSYTAPPTTGLDIFTERSKQLELSKSTNGKIALYARTSEEYAKFWNDMHLMVVGLTAKQIKEMYNSKESAKQVLRIYAPHLEATEAIIEDFWQKGIGLDRIKDTGLHTSLAYSFKAMLDLGIDLKTLGK
jgi:prophage antirepressor-like protein